MNPNNFPPPPPEYANRPNLWRLYCEIARCKHPDLVLNALLALGKSGMLDALREEKDR